MAVQPNDVSDRANDQFIEGLYQMLSEIAEKMTEDRLAQMRCDRCRFWERGEVGMCGNLKTYTRPKFGCIEFEAKA